MFCSPGRPQHVVICRVQSGGQLVLSNKWTGLSSSSSLTHLLPAGVHTLRELLHRDVHQLLQGKDGQRPRIQVAVSIEHVLFRACDLLGKKMKPLLLQLVRGYFPGCLSL